ncbi:MAG: polysaccharide deacetylase family protein [Spirochaetales bacterium]|nr:polysaccharide deacetylase family protein [Spirochaetales bacterium]
MSIITEKSLGFSCRKKEPAGQSGRKKIRPLLRGLPLAGASAYIKLAGTGVLLVLCVFLFVFCRTTPLGDLEEGSEGNVMLETAESDASSASPSAALTTEKAPIKVLPDNLKTIKNLKYTGESLQGVFWRERDFDKRVYLTFDDGPNLDPIEGPEGMTTVCDSILDTLAERNLKASFFINGKNLEYSSPEEKADLNRLMMRIIDEGHLIGNHSYHHYNLAQGIFADGNNDEELIAGEFIMTQNALDDVLGFEYPMVLTRPPYAEPGRTEDLDNWLRSVGYYHISLQFDSYDYAYKEGGRWNREALLVRMAGLLEEQPSGGVVLLHELASTAAFLPEMIDRVILPRDLRVENLDHLLVSRYGN